MLVMKICFSSLLANLDCLLLFAIAKDNQMQSSCQFRFTWQLAETTSRVGAGLYNGAGPYRATKTHVIRLMAGFKQRTQEACCQSQWKTAGATKRAA